MTRMARLGLTALVLLLCRATAAQATDCCQVSTGCADNSYPHINQPDCENLWLGVWKSGYFCDCGTRLCLVKGSVASAEPAGTVGCCPFGFESDCCDEPDTCVEAAVPAVSEWGSVVLVLSILTVGTAVLARRRGQARA